MTAAANAANASDSSPCYPGPGAISARFPGMMRIDIENARSYATLHRLLLGIERAGFNEFRFLPVRNAAGRWTAIFTLSGLDIFLSEVAGFGFPVIS